ncbi:nuclear transport factor 2 family protein [Allosphingosinicella deserti]|uniref:DUF4440 domain-containing protein n=1 Tax=Allosphingosinicella deserti TaxID=2116704 RepID=A0A2P7QHD8_9SPHN|nr:nuclear transport factor 2 family protein [Sphingomonas deserti]PSJ37391.1 hypothetical protein C7I55_23030 [Sphingomonas deserti]
MKGLAGIAIIVAIWSSIPGPATSAPAQDDAAKWRADLVAFADRFDRAQLAKDRAALEDMIADDLIFIDRSGARSGKEAFIEGWTRPRVHYDPVVLIDRIVVPLGADSGIVTAETTLGGISDGVRFTSRFRFADTFKRIRGRWQAVHIQVTGLPAPPAP